MSEKRLILLFVKYPSRGKVKSRLAEDLNEEAAICLYRRFVGDILNTLKECGYPFAICYDPPDAIEKTSEWLGEGNVYVPQLGNDLGDKMKNAFLRTFSQGFSRVLLIGSDLPDLSCSLLRDAFALDHFDAVIGPSFDGGYYLIGFKHDTFSEEIFDNMHWSTQGVFRETMVLFRRRRYLVHVLPERRDIDRAADLRDFAERNRDSDFTDSETMQYIREHRETLFSEMNTP